MRNQAYDKLYSHLAELKLGAWVESLRTLTHERLDPANHSDLHRWQMAIDRFPKLKPARLEFNVPAVTVSGKLGQSDQENLRASLWALHPWRKGPFDFYGIKVDTEWRSDLKWERVRNHIDLQGKSILDVGSGNGYYGYRMLGAGAKFVCGLDPFLLYVMQYHAANELIGSAENYVLPLGDDVLSQKLLAFDYVFSMGVLYHRRSPLNHLADLRNALNHDGQLVLETLVVDDGSELLFPNGRYAKMRNVWFIPSVSLLQQWLERIGFGDVQVIDVTKTTTTEQRRTDWMEFESLPDFLDPVNSNLTIEGYPAPVRAIILARKR